MFEGVTGKLGALGAKFPVVNTLMNAIRRRKNRVRACVCIRGPVRCVWASGRPGV